MSQSFSLLIADDEKVIREGIRRILSKEDLEIFLVENGLQAWEALQQQSFDLLLVDLKMPQLDGMELLQRVKKPIPTRLSSSLPATPPLKRRSKP